MPADKYRITDPVTGSVYQFEMDHEPTEQEQEQVLAEARKLWGQKGPAMDAKPERINLRAKLSSGQTMEMSGGQEGAGYIGPDGRADSFFRQLASAKLAPTAEEDYNDGGAFGRIAINGKPISPEARRWINSAVGLPLMPIRGAQDVVEGGVGLIRDTFRGGLGGGQAFSGANLDRLEGIVKGVPLAHPLEEALRGGMAEGYLPEERMGQVTGRFREALAQDWKRDPLGTVAQALLAAAGVGGAARMARGSGIKAAGRAALDVAGAPRAIMASFDLSAPGRQGLPLTPYLLAKNPKGYALAWKEMLKSAQPGDFIRGAGEVNYETAKAGLMQHPDYSSAVTAGVDFAHLNGSDAGWGSTAAQKLPGVSMSERGFNAFMDRLRVEAFSSMKRAAEKGGKLDAKDTSDLARFVNVATGRGEVGMVGRALKPITDHGLFSAKNTAARFQYLDPARYIMMSPAARKQALGAMMGHAGTVGAALGMAAGAGAQVTLDPESADFGKVRVGNTRYEVSGGYSRPIRFLLRASLAAKEGNTKEVARLVGDYVRRSASPLGGAVSDKFFPDLAPKGSRNLSDLFIPLVVQDLMDVVATEGKASAGKAAPAVVGVGVQSYEDRDKSR
jgi:hypothetical protein